MPSKRYRPTARKMYKTKSYAYKKRRTTTRSRSSFTKSGYTKGQLGGLSSDMSATIVRGNDWMSNKLITKMEYMEQVYYTSVTPPQTYIFRGNSIYDPNQTGTGGQPLGMTNLTAIYSVFECPSSSIRVEWINNTAVPCWIVLVPVINTSDAITYNNSQGRPGVKTVYCPSNASDAHGVVTNSASTFKMTNLQPGGTGTRSLVSTNPGQQWYWNITITPCDGASALSGVLNVKVIYSTIFSDRKVV